MGSGTELGRFLRVFIPTFDCNCHLIYNFLNIPDRANRLDKLQGV